MPQEGEELAARVAEVLAVDAESFSAQVEEDAAVVLEAIDEGVFDNHQATIGLEYELYGIDEDGHLDRVPRRITELTGFEKELGLHNVEMNTTPQPLNAAGLAAQEAEIRARLTAAQEIMHSEDRRLVSDSLWTIPPAGEGAIQYLTDSVSRSVTVEGSDRQIRIASNMSDAARYHAMANTRQSEAAGMQVEAPNVTIEADTVMPESLITSIQPHYQVRQVSDLPTYFNYALRIAGPLLALAVNSPFFPPECYDDVSPEDILADAWMEHRIAVFESVLNAPGGSVEKVCFPRDLDSVTEAVERIAGDTTFVPMPVETGARFDDQFAHFRTKHGTYWRWVRPVFEGESRESANVRIEFRPASSQPTLRDSVAIQAAFAGLMVSLPRLKHPVLELPWETARENFYAAMRNGVQADLEWITNDGEEIAATDAVLDEVLAHAEDGLRTTGLSAAEAQTYLAPLHHRVRQGVTPARWKYRLVEAAVGGGTDFRDAVEQMQRRYFELQEKTLLDGSFADWTAATRDQFGNN